MGHKLKQHYYCPLQRETTGQTRTDREKSDKEIPMCHYASQSTQ